MTSKYRLGICEIHNPYVHGGNYENEPYLQGVLLLSYIFTPEEIYENEHISTLEIMQLNYTSMSPTNIIHPIIQNYSQIVNNVKYYQLHIIEKIELETGETLAIIKTHNTISLLQRKWKSYYKKILQLAKQRSHPNNLLYRKIYGKWKI
jgi:hypothetical protein